MAPRCSQQFEFSGCDCCISVSDCALITTLSLKECQTLPCCNVQLLTAPSSCTGIKQSRSVQPSSWSKRITPLLFIHQPWLAACMTKYRQQAVINVWHVLQYMTGQSAYECSMQYSGNTTSVHMGSALQKPYFVLYI